MENQNSFFCFAGSLPTCNPDGSGKIMGPGPDQYNICDCLVPNYLPSLPSDPEAGFYKNCQDYDTQYEICQTPQALSLRAPKAQMVSELGEVKLTVPNSIKVLAPGKNLNQAVSPIRWKARYGYTSVVFDNKIWVMRGWDESFRNDVWYSP